MAVSEWVEKYRVAPADSPVPGPWRNATTPYLVGIMDAIMRPHVQEAAICAPPQTGKTDLALNIAGYTTDRVPGNWLIVYPDEKTAGDLSRDRVQPMFQESPRLRKYLTGAVDDMSAHRLTLKNSRIYFAWASSASRLASRPLPFVLLDEVDKYPAVANSKEAGPIDLARKRTRTFGHMRKIIRVSTPTVEAGPIWQALETEAEAVFVYWVRCPLCDAWQLMDFTSIKWNGGGDADPREILSDPASTWYECPECGGHWDDARRDLAVAAGTWRDRETGDDMTDVLETKRPVSIGFHYPAWISRFVPLREAAGAFIKGQNDISALKDFANAYEARPWKIQPAGRDVDKILTLVDPTRPRGLVPGGDSIAVITAGIDTQDSGFWYWLQAWEWAKPGTRPIGHCIRAGFVTDFEALSQVLWQDLPGDADGNRYAVSFSLQDAMGHRTAEVYDFCRMNPGRIAPSIGRQKLAKPFQWSKQSSDPGGLQAVIVSTQYFKDEVASALQVLPEDPGSLSLYDQFPEDYARQLSVEYVNENGVWECPDGKDNHLWDCLVLNFCALEILDARYWTKPETQPTPRPRPQRRKPERVRRW